MSATRSTHRSATAAARTPETELTELVDGRHGRVRASGQLTSQGADLLRGTIEGLRRLGHSTVVLDLTGVQAADAAGLHVLSSLVSSMAAAGDRLLVRNPPTVPTPR